MSVAVLTRSTRTWTKVNLFDYRNARRVWFWRHSSLIFTFVICFICGGILSEIVQSLLPVKSLTVKDSNIGLTSRELQYKEFQFGDLVVRIFTLRLMLLLKL